MKVAVYCSAKESIPKEYKELGVQVGEWLAKEGHTLVYGGATGGLMSRVSETFRKHKKAKQRIIGVIPHRIIASGRQADNCDRLIIVKDMAERKRRMRKIADCFICLPGSYGTLDEMYDVIASGTVGEHKKPIYIVNYNGFYNGLKEAAAHMRELKFLPAEESYKPQFVDSLEDLKGIIK